MAEKPIPPGFRQEHPHGRFQFWEPPLCRRLIPPAAGEHHFFPGTHQAMDILQDPAFQLFPAAGRIIEPVAFIPDKETYPAGPGDFPEEIHIRPMELSSKDTQEQIVLEGIECTEIGIFRECTGIIAGQVHIDHIRTFHDLGLPSSIRGLADPGHPLSRQFIDQGTFPGSWLSEQADLDFMIPLPLPGLQELGYDGFGVPCHFTASFIPAVHWPGST